MISPPSQVPLLLSVASPNLVIPVAGPSGIQQNFLKRRTSDNLNPSPKRHCNSPDFKRSAKLTEEISSILKTAVISTELDKPSTRLPIENFSSERTLIHQAFMDLPIGILDDGIGKQDISVLQDESQTFKNDYSTFEGELLSSTVDFSQILSVPLEESNLAHKEVKKSKKSKKYKKSKEDKKEKKRNKKDKERRKERRRHEAKDHETKNSEEQVPAMSLKIRIPKDRLNLSNDFLLASGSESKSPYNGSLKIKISKKRLNYCDTYSTIPV